MVTVQVWMVTGLDGSRGAKFTLPLNVCLERWKVTKVNTNASNSPLFIMAMLLGRSELPIKPFILAWLGAGWGRPQPAESLLLMAV